MNVISIINGILMGVKHDIHKHYKLDECGYPGDSMSYFFDGIVNTVGRIGSHSVNVTSYTITVEIDVNKDFDDSSIDALIDDSHLTALRFSFLESKHLLYVMDANTPSTLVTLDKLLAKFKLIGYSNNLKISISTEALNLMAIHCANRIRYDHIFKIMGTMYVDRDNVYRRLNKYKKRGHMASLLY